MSEDSASNYLRRERVTDALLEFERRIHERILSVDDSECWDLLLNRPPARHGSHPLPAADHPVLRYETHDNVSLLRVVEPDGENRACFKCELFGQSHCGGGLAFLFFALRAAGSARPLEWLAVEMEPSLYLPDWELMWENRRSIFLKLREYFERNLQKVSCRPDDSVSE